MKTIVIAAGYATRLGELTRNFPKPLLKIGENTILGRMLDDIDVIPDITEHIVVTNHKFAPIFSEWAAARHYTKPLTIVDDGTETNETRLGAVCDLLYAMDKFAIDDDLLVVAADNLLFFSFREFVEFAKAKGTSCIMCHRQPDVEKLRRTGVIEVDGVQYTVADRGGSGLSKAGKIDIFTPEGHAACLKKGIGSCTIKIVRLGW